MEELLFHPDCQKSLSAVQAAVRVNKEIIFSEKLIRSSVKHETHKLGRLYLQVISAAAVYQSPGGPNPNWALIQWWITASLWWIIRRVK